MSDPTIVSGPGPCRTEQRLPLDAIFARGRSPSSGRPRKPAVSGGRSCGT